MKNMKKPTPEQLEGLKKKYANLGYESTMGIVEKAKPQTPEGWKEQEK